MTVSSKPTRVIGVDFGRARIGLSYSDMGKQIASPLDVVLAAKKSDITVKSVVQRLEEHCRQLDYAIETIVVGLPLMMSGERGMMADEVEFFVEKLRTFLPDIPIVTLDERLTSLQAERMMSGISRKKRSSKVDIISAVIILQSFLDRGCR